MSPKKHWYLAVSEFVIRLFYVTNSHSVITKTFLDKCFIWKIKVSYQNYIDYKWISSDWLEKNSSSFFKKNYGTIFCVLHTPYTMYMDILALKEKRNCIVKQILKYLECICEFYFSLKHLECFQVVWNFKKTPSSEFWSALTP